MNSANGMKRFISVCSLLVLTSCAVNSQQIGVTTSPSAVLNTNLYQLASYSEVKSFNDEWNEYVNHQLNIVIKFPKYVVDEPVYDPTIKRPLQSMHVVENGEIISFLQDYKLDHDHLDQNSLPIKVTQQAVVKTPYYLPQYQNDPSYPYQIYLAQAKDIEQVQAFAERAYGASCLLSSPSGYTDRPGIQAFNLLNKPGKKCPNFYDVGDIVIWNADKQAVIGLQPGFCCGFLKPYHVNKSTSLYYQLEVDGFTASYGS